MANGDEDSSDILISADLRKETDRRLAFGYVLGAIRMLLDCRKLAPPKPFVNPHLLLDALVQCQKELRVFHGPDEFKMGGRLGFWIARIKPFRALELTTIYTNEALGLWLALSLAAEKHGAKSIHHKVQANLLYDLRYGTVTASVFSNQLQLLYCEEIKRQADTPKGA